MASNSHLVTMQRLTSQIDSIFSNIIGKNAQKVFYTNETALALIHAIDSTLECSEYSAQRVQDLIISIIVNFFI